MAGAGEDRLVALLERLVAACERLADQAVASDPPGRRGGRKPRPAGEAAVSPADAGADSTAGDLRLPAEVGTAEAAELLGVSKDTLLEYKKKGLLPFRNLAPPGSTKPMFMFPLDAVVKLRTTYQTEEPAPDVPHEPPRRVMKGRRQFKHLILDEES